MLVLVCFPGSFVFREAPCIGKEDLFISMFRGKASGRLESGSFQLPDRSLTILQIHLCPQIMKEVRRALCNAATDDSKLLLLSAVGSVFCSGLDYSYLIGRLSNDRRKESTRIAEAIR